MNWRRGLTLVCLFCIDVHVKAEPVLGVDGCWGKKIPCAVEASHAREVLKAADLMISMSSSALLDQFDEKTIQLARGRFYVETSRPVAFKTPYAKVWCSEDCKGIFAREPSQLTVLALAGKWLVNRTGDEKTYGIPEGMQMLFSEVTPEGAAAMEFPQSLPWEPTVIAWSSLYPGKMKDFKPLVAEFREVWKAAVEKASEMHQEQAQRTIASYENELAQERARQAAREREDAKLRALFREKNP